jgi:hypothetical protein
MIRKERKCLTHKDESKIMPKNDFYILVTTKCYCSYRYDREKFTRFTATIIVLFSLT